MLYGEGLSGVLLLTQNSEDQRGFLLDRLIRRAEAKREDFYFDLSEPGWFERAKSAGVKVVVPLGEKSLRRVTGNTEIYRYRGRVLDHPDWPFFVLPTFNPKYLLPRRQPTEGERDPEIMRNPSRWQGRFIRDLAYARHISQHGFTRAKVSYLLDPSPAEFDRWVDEYLRTLDSGVDPRLAFDEETPYKVDHASDEEEQEEKERFNERNLDIIRWSFSYKFAHAVSIPNDGMYRRSIERLLREKAEKVTTNGRDFDYPVALYNGYEINGRHYDTFDLVKFWQSDLDKGLEVISADTTDLLPWKHMSDARPDWYSAVDADASWREAEYIIREIKKQGAWEVFLETFTDLMPHMVRAGERGNVIDLPYQEQLKKEFAVESERLDVQIQQVVPLELKPRHRYKREPFERVGYPPLNVLAHGGKPIGHEQGGRLFISVLEPNEVKVCSACGKWPVTKGEHTSKKSLGKTLLEERHHPKKCGLGGTLSPLLLESSSEAAAGSCSCPKGWPKRKWDVQLNPCHGAEIKLETHPTEEWDEVLPFNVNSSQQLIAYMHAHKHPVAQNPDNPDKEAADREHLKMLDRTYGKKHPMYGLALGAKQVNKAKSTYVWIPRELEPLPLIHQTYKNVPNTLRMSGTAYNLMNVGKKQDKNPWAVRARRQIVARPGFVFVNADSTSIEGVMQGWYMGDEHYMWLANQSIHAWLATKRLGWDFNPDMIEKVKREQKKLYDGFKVANYCVTGDHEVLTPTGWVRFDELNATTPVAEWNPKTEQLEFQVPKEVVKFDYSGPMHVWKSRSMSAVMTPNHHLPVYYDAEQELPHYEQAQEIKETGRLPVVGTLTDTGIHQTEFTDTQVQLMAALQADGSYLYRGVVAFQFKKVRKIKRMRELLKGRNYREQTKNAVTHFKLEPEEMSDITAMLDNKKFHLPLLLNLPQRQKQLLLDEITKWDGSEPDSGTYKGVRRVYFSKERQNAEAVQTLAQVSGVHALLRYVSSGLWTVSFNQAKRTRVSNIKKEVVEYTGQVYCLTSSTQYFLIRHNDRVWISGNTINFGGSAYGMHMSNRDVFPSLADAERTQEMVFELIPTLEAYQYQQRFKAQKQGYIESPWKWRAYFYDVFTYKRNKFGDIEYTPSGRPRLKLSKDGKRVVAVLPQHSNAMFARQTLKMIGDSEWGQYMPANVFVHDGYQLEVPIARAEAAEDYLLNLLTRPIPEMGNLRVAAASDIGSNWGDEDPKREIWADGNPQGMKSSRKMTIEKQELLFMGSSSEELARAA